MPLSASNLTEVSSQAVTSGANGFTFSSGPAAGASIVVVVYHVGTITDMTTGTNGAFELDYGPVALTDGFLSVYRKFLEVLEPAQSTFTASAGGGWIIFYTITNLYPEPPVAVTSNTDSAIGNGEILSTGFTADQLDQWDVLNLAVFAAHNPTVTATTWGGYTGVFAESHEVGGAQSGGQRDLAAAVAFPQAAGSYETTATLTTTGTASAGALMLAYRSLADPLVFCSGAEFGTLAGATVGGTNVKLIPLVVGAPSVISDTPHNGAYCFRCSATAATCALGFNAAAVGGNANNIGSVAIRFRTALPPADVDLIVFTPISGTVVAIRYVAATTQLAADTAGGSGSPTLGPTVVADTWYVINWWWHFEATAANRELNWRVDGALQTVLEMPLVIADLSTQHLGWPVNAATASVDYDDWCVSVTQSDWPLGDPKVLLLTPDTATSLTLTGTTGNWRTFTNNGTLTAWNASAALLQIDEVPPTIGSTADGLTQVTAATGDFVTIPMTTYTLTANEAVIGLRVVVCGWAASTAAATFGFRAYNGAAEEILQAGTVNPSFNNSTTAPGWFAKMCSLANFDTQAELDAFAIRAGYASDATPDEGINAAYAEVAISAAAAAPVSSRPRRRNPPQYRR